MLASGKGTPLSERNLLGRALKPAGDKLGTPWLSWHVFATRTPRLGNRSAWPYLTDKHRWDTGYADDDALHAFGPEPETAGD